MSALKSEVKAALAFELGSAYEDMLEAAKHELQRSGGQKSGLLTGRTKLEEHMKIIDRDVDSGQLTLDEAGKCKKYMVQGLNILQNLAMQAEVQAYLSQGKVQALEGVVKSTKKVYDSEQTKAKNLAEYEAAVAATTAATSSTVEEDSDATPTPPRRPVGAHPGRSVAQVRKAASAARRAAEAATQSTPDVGEPEPEAQESLKDQK